jgi:alpha-methylacyl-CoA racemase
MPGPLEGQRIIEIASLGPGPFAAMLLADMGADVLRIARASEVTGHQRDPRLAPINRGRRSVAVDLKKPGGAEVVLRLVEQADGLIEGFRPGVMERLGLGPEPCLARNRRLVYGRITGYGQDGPYAGYPGHDISYIALVGALDAIGRAGSPPVPPLNLVADFGGGGMLIAFGMVCALLEAHKSGLGQVIDAAMVDGTALLMTAAHGQIARGSWRPPRGTNQLDSGAPYYEVYQTADDLYVSVGAGEPQFYAALLALLDIPAESLPPRDDRSHWPATKARFAERFRTRTRQQWCSDPASVDACVTPVLGMREAPSDPHNAFRGTFIAPDGIMQAAPAPRLSRTPGEVSRPPAAAGAHTREALAEWGFSPAEIDKLESEGVVADLRRPAVREAGPSGREPNQGAEH